MNVSLKAIWPNLLWTTPTIVVHHGRYGEGRRLRDRLKYWSTRFFENVSVSQAVARCLPVASRVIGNCYDDRVFRRLNGNDRRGIAYVGRLVSEKRVHVLLEAAALLA